MRMAGYRPRGVIYTALINQLAEVFCSSLWARRHSRGLLKDLSDRNQDVSRHDLCSCERNINSKLYYSQRLSSEVIITHNKPSFNKFSMK